MNVSTLADDLQRFISNVDADTVKQTMNENLMIALIVVAVIGVLWSLFGLKLVRLWGALLGFVIGAGVGAAVSVSLNLDTTIMLVVTAGAGIVMAFLAGFFYRLGAFLMAWAAGSYLATALLDPQDWILVAVCAAIGLVVALLTLKFLVVITIVATSIMGAVLAGDAIATLIGTDNSLIRYAIMLVIAVIGGIVQFTMESGKRKKKNLKKAAEIREQNSTENEVEKARAMFGDLDEEEEESKDEKKAKREAKKEAKRAKKSDRRSNKKSKAETVDKMEDTILLDDEFDDEYGEQDDEESGYIDGYNPDDYTDLDDLEDDEDFIIITDDDE